MKIVNFSTYHTNLRQINRALVSLFWKLGLIVILVLSSYYLLIRPSRNIYRHSRLLDIYKSRYRFAEKLLMQLEIKKQYILQYSSFLRRQEFTKFWEELWPFLYKYLPENAWVRDIRWVRGKKANRHFLMIRGMVLLDQEHNLDYFNRKFHELKAAISLTNMSNFVRRVRIRQGMVDDANETMSFLLIFEPKGTL